MKTYCLDSRYFLNCLTQLIINWGIQIVSNAYKIRRYDLSSCYKTLHVLSILQKIFYPIWNLCKFLILKQETYLLCNGDERQNGQHYPRHLILTPFTVLRQTQRQVKQHVNQRQQLLHHRHSRARPFPPWFMRARIASRRYHEIDSQLSSSFIRDFE